MTAQPTVEPDGGQTFWSHAQPGRSSGGLAGRAWPRPGAGAGHELGAKPNLLATAAYVTGTASLEPGRRYGIAIRGSRFQVLGPLDLDSNRIALDRPLANIHVSALEGRLIVSDQSGSGVALAFMSVAGARLEELAGAIHAAAREGDA